MHIHIVDSVYYLRVKSPLPILKRGEKIGCLTIKCTSHSVRIKVKLRIYRRKETLFNFTNFTFSMYRIRVYPDAVLGDFPVKQYQSNC